MMGLMRFVTQRLPDQHSVIVLGDAIDSDYLRNQGLSILGSVQGTDNRSRTLGTRLHRVIEKVSRKKDKVIAWGWTPAVAVSGLECVQSVVAYIDSIDSVGSLELDIDRVIPTTWTSGERLKKSRGCGCTVTEPLVGIDAKTLVLDQSSVYKGLSISSKSTLVAVVNDVGSWQEIVETIVLMQALGVDMEVVVSSNYHYYSELYFALKERGISHLVRRVPKGLRLVDVVHAASLIWAPTSAVSGKLDGVLDLLSSSASGVPVAASRDHAITGVPTIGRRLGWVSSPPELCEWILDLVQGSMDIGDRALEIAARVRSIASLARFVEGFQLRL